MKWITIAEYAKIEAISIQAAYKRVRCKNIASKKVYNIILVKKPKPTI